MSTEERGSTADGQMQSSRPPSGPVRNPWTAPGGMKTNVPGPTPSAGAVPVQAFTVLIADRVGKSPQASFWSAANVASSTAPWLFRTGTVFVPKQARQTQGYGRDRV